MTLGPIKTVGIYVEDQARALEFYEKELGFAVRRRLPMTPGTEWLEVSPPGAESCLVLYPKALMPNWGELKPSVVFHADDVEGLAERLRFGRNDHDAAHEDGLGRLHEVRRSGRQ